MERVHKFATPAELDRRYLEITRFEELLAGSGTKIVKFYLHIDKH